MNHGKFFLIVLCAASFALSSCAPKPPRDRKKAAPPIAPLVIPSVREFSGVSGTFPVDARTPVIFSGGDGAAAAANYFVGLARGNPLIPLTPPTKERSKSGAISFVLAPGDQFEEEGYAVSIADRGATVTARTPAGLFYGAVTLWELLSAVPVQDLRGGLPMMEIKDSPRFGWRGLMLDSARHFQSPEYIKQFIDWMALHKLNVLHWHLTDDQAWRLEIRKYPKLTSVGAWRVPEGAAARADIDEKTGKPRLYGGFYTQDQARDIVAYAAARHVRVIPEIEMPGHATAAIVAYPALGVPPASNNLKAVPSDWGVYENLFNVEDSTFGFLEDVLGEVMQVFPDEYIHLGGDEAVKPQWEGSARVKARMKELGVKDAHELQGYFIQRMSKFLAAHGKRVIGWDEILEGGGLPDSATVMSWRGIDGAVTAAKSGHDTVLSPAPDLYFDHWQSPGDIAPGRSDTLSLKMVYGFNPLPATVPAEQRRHILGLQANLWTELMRTEQRVTYMAYPRAAALAEVAWSDPSRIDFQDFERRLEAQLPRYDKLGIRFAREVAVTPLPKRRLSHDLAQCGDGYLLSLEDDAPVDGERATFLVNISNPCWIWRQADLTGSNALRFVVGQLPFNFQIGADAAKIPLPRPKTRWGELEVRFDSCDGEPFASVPLDAASMNDGLTTLPPVALYSTTGKHDICIRFTRAKLDPMWAVSSVELIAN